MKLSVTCPACGDLVECEIALTVGDAEAGENYVNVDAEIVSGPEEHFKDQHAA